MTTNSPRFSSVNNMVKNNEYKLNLFEPQIDGDWTRAIHHELNIKRRTCTTFIPKTPATIDPGRSRSEIQCGCNRLKREHSWNIFDGDEPKWDQALHTTSAYNNAYGYIPHTHAHYLRCDIETKPDILAKFMFEVWKVKAPRLIMCIIGGAKYFKLNERLEREFIKGIIQAALKADGWIVTTGFKTGVVQLVGEAIYDHKVTNPRSHITAIGCSKWGATKNRQSLIVAKSSTDPNLDASANPSKNEKGQQDLEPNHTHFLLLDDGTYYGYEIGDYRTRFVHAASHYNDKDVPIVTIVVEGGPDTLSTIYNDLSNDIPVVLIDGSGRLPNLLANFLTRTESMINRKGKDDDAANWKQVIDIKNTDDFERLKTRFRPYADEIREGIREITKGSNTSDKKKNNLFNCFLYCLQPAVRSKIRIYSLDSDHNLDDTIFEAIIEAKLQNSSVLNKAVQRKKLLDLALAWDAIEVAKEHIIKDDLSDLDQDAKKKLFVAALKRDSPQFVHIFIKLNFDISQIFYERQTNKPWKLIWNQLADLYKHNDKQNKDRLFLLEKCHGKRQIESAHELDEILRNLIGDYMKSIYTRPPAGIAGKLETCCSWSQGARIADSHETLYREDNHDGSEVPDPEEAEKEVRELVYRDLFLWAILTNRIEMSKVILSYMQTRICAALIATKVLKSYSKYAHDNESKETLQSQAEQFEEYANQCLKCCYNSDEDKACEIAIRRINVFGSVSCLQVAVDADDKLFVGQPCCNLLLNNIWYYKMDPYQSAIQKRIGLLLSICTFGLLAPFLVSFREDQSISDGIINENQKRNYEMTVNQTEEETEALLIPSTQRLNKYGIDYSDTYRSRLDCCPKGCTTYFRRLLQFHESPFIKFTYNCASYICFLLLFSYYLLFQFNIPTNDIPSIDWTEILVIIIVSTMLIEDTRQFLCQDNRSLRGKLKNYFITNIFYNSIRVTSFVLFYIGLILRFAYASNDLELSVAKIILAYDLEIWYIRSLAFLSVARKMGPKLVMIRRMLIDLSFFIYIILTAMIGYGVASRSMYNYYGDPDNGTLTFDGRSIFRRIMYPTYYLMYGSQDAELQALDQNPEAGTAIATQVLLAFHMLFVNILLINLLIAMFSFTFESVQAHTDLVWRFERYSLIREYFDRPPLFPPFIIITHFIELIKLILRHSVKAKRSNAQKRRAKTFKMIGINRDIDKDWSEFESYATNLYARTVVSGQPSSTVALVSSTANQEIPQTSLDMYNNAQLPSNFDVKAMTDEMASIKRVVGDLRTYAEEMNRCMRWMMDAMDRVKMSKEPKPILRPAVTTDDLKLTDE